MIGWHRVSLFLKKHSYSIQEGLMQHHVEIELPEHIESAHTMKRVYFSAYGLPYDGTEFILQDLQTGATNRIWISVQTGRIRLGIIVIMTCVQIRMYPKNKHRLRTEQSGFFIW